MGIVDSQELVEPTFILLRLLENLPAVVHSPWGKVKDCKSAVLGQYRAYIIPGYRFTDGVFTKYYAYWVGPYDVINILAPDDLERRPIL